MRRDVVLICMRRSYAHLIDLGDEGQTEYLNSALCKQGLDSCVSNNGVKPDGGAVFAIFSLNAGD
jgi:hypothetical protein